MSGEGVLKVNHRELILSSHRKSRFHFLRLPHDLQDEIISGMDGNILTLYQARELASKNGFPLSHEAISDYYGAVRSRRADLLSGAVTV